MHIKHQQETISYLIIKLPTNTLNYTHPRHFLIATLDTRLNLDVLTRLHFTMNSLREVLLKSNR